METFVSENIDLKTEIADIIAKQRLYFNKGLTQSYEARKKALETLKKMLTENEEIIKKALYEDLRKPDFEAYTTEIGVVLVEIEHTLKHLKSWMQPNRVATPLLHFIGSSYIYSDPYGIVLNIAPWNYPFQLLVSPLVGILAAGNCAVLKPSELAPATSKVSATLFKKYFDESLIKVIEGGIPETQILLEQKYDYIFFTGGTNVGKIVYQAAAKHLTPVTLELGGKSPCVVDKNCDITISARRIVWGKFINAGQTCIAPDYLMVQKDVKDKFLTALRSEIKDFYGEDPQQSKDFCRIINERHFDRLEKYLEDGKTLIGGKTDRSDKYIAPTVLEVKDTSKKVMQEEIFGPILPIIEYNNIQEAINFINERPKPLALYFFSEDSNNQELVLKNTSSGGACINETIMHITNGNLPFGGVGDSGIGAYHGQSSFKLFSHQKSVMKRSTLIDVKLRYAPYNKGLNQIKTMMKWFM
jgi:aldehyde dehydrogenase (NAD+)